MCLLKVTLLLVMLFANTDGKPEDFGSSLDGAVEGAAEGARDEGVMAAADMTGIGEMATALGPSSAAAEGYRRRRRRRRWISLAVTQAIKQGCKAVARATVKAITKGLAARTAAKAAAKGAAKRGLKLLWENMAKRNAKRYMMEQALKGIAGKIAKSKALNMDLEEDIQKAKDLADKKVGELAMKAVKLHLLRSSSQKRLDKAGQAAARAYVNEVMKFEWTDLIPGWGEYKLCTQINDLFGTTNMQKRVEEAVQAEFTELIGEYDDFEKDVLRRVKDEYPDLGKPAAPAVPKKSKAAQIKELFELLRMGALTQEEFDAEKKAILNP